MSTIEVIYNCKDKVGIARMTMTITSEYCDPFTIYWDKECTKKGK